MNTLAINRQVGAKQVRFDGNLLRLYLTDGRAVMCPFEQIPWSGWRAKATSEQCNQWSIAPAGFAVSWEELGDGIEVVHTLSLELVIYPRKHL